MKYLLLVSILFSINLMAQDTAPKPPRQEKKGAKIEKCDCQCHKDSNKHPRSEKGKHPSGRPPHRNPKPDGSIQ